MDAENLVVDDGSHGEAVEALNKLLPQLQAVSSFALIVKAINPIDGTTLMVSSKEKEVFRVLDLVSHHETYNF